MDQDGNSTASFGSNNNMTSSETTNVAMAGQTVASEKMSSVNESSITSSESALGTIPRRGSSRGRGQERPARQRNQIPDQFLPKIPDFDSGPDGLGRGRSALPRSSRGTQIGERSRSPTPVLSSAGQPVTGRQVGR